MYSKKLILLFILPGLLLLFGCSKKFHLRRDIVIPPSDWPMTRHDLQSTASVKTEFSGRLNVIWEAKASDAPIGPLTIGAGKLIFPGSKGRVSFYDLQSGKYCGRYKSKSGVQTGVVIVDSLAYMGIGPSKNRFVCINLHNNKEIWRVSLKDVSGQPIIVDNRLYVASAANLCLCLDRLSGEIIWRDSIGGVCKAGPSYDNGVIYFPCDDGKLLGYDAMTGELILEKAFGQPLMSKVVAGHTVYVADIGGGLYAVMQNSGRKVWERKFDWPIWTSPAVDDKAVFIGDNGGYLHALDKTTGHIIWRFKSDGVILSSPVIVGDYLVFASLDRYLYCLDKKTGHLVSKRFFNNEIHFPAVVTGKSIIVALQNGSIQCLGE